MLNKSAFLECDYVSNEFYFLCAGLLGERHPNTPLPSQLSTARFSSVQYRIKTQRHQLFCACAFMRFANYCLFVSLASERRRSTNVLLRRLFFPCRISRRLSYVCQSWTESEREGSFDHIAQTRVERVPPLFSFFHLPPFPLLLWGSERRKKRGRFALLSSLLLLAFCGDIDFRLPPPPFP